MNEQSGVNIYNLLFVEGDYVKKKQSLGSVKIGGNVGNFAIQNENTTQTNGNNDLSTAFDEIFERIKGIDNDVQREQAIFNAEILRNAVKENDVDKGKRVLEFLRNSIGTIGSLTTIAKFFGITI